MSEEPRRTISGSHRAVCPMGSDAECPTAAHVSTDAKVLAAIDAREAKMYGLLKWLFGGVSVLALAFGAAVWAQSADAGNGGERAAAAVDVRLVVHEAQSARIHEMQSGTLRALELHSERQDVMLEMLVRDRGMRVPPPVDGGP